MIIIKEGQRVWWDVLVMITILFVVFEVPYDLLVSWTNNEFKHWVDLIVLFIFLADIFLNCLTVRSRSNAGFWGWRHFAGLINVKWSVSNAPGYQDETIPIERQPGIVLSYLSSGWFLIDILAVIPFDLIFSSLEFFEMSRTFRLARTLRLMRLIRGLRAVKIFRLFTVVESVLGSRPAMLRFLLLGLFVAWSAHIHACVFYFAEHDNPGTPIITYEQALHYVFITFTTADLAECVTRLGYWASVSSVLFGITFFGLFIGNFSSFFSELDHDQYAFEEQRKQWESLFKTYPQVFTMPLRRRIIEAVKRRQIWDHSIEAQVALIQTLDSQLEIEVKTGLEELSKENKSKKLADLLYQLSQEYRPLDESE